MRILVIGVGSIGSRRARLLAEMGHEVHGCDPIVGSEDLPISGNQLWSDIGEALADVDFDAVLICTPPDRRVEVLAQCVDAEAQALYIEKPLSVTPEAVDVVELLVQDVPVTMGACNMRFDARLPERHEVTTTVFARMGQAAKHWSPNHQPISLILDSIHELDLIQYYAGPVTGISGTSTIARAAATTFHESRIWGGLDLDRVTDPPVRTLACDDKPVNLWPPDMEMYRREMEHFVDCVERGEQTCNPISEAADLMRQALKVVLP